MTVDYPVSRKEPLRLARRLETLHLPLSLACGAMRILGSIVEIPTRPVPRIANQDIGTIKDLAYSGGGLKAYIVGVGGFLGMADHYVAVNPSAVHMTYDAGNESWHATMSATADQLKAAPEFKYPS